MATLVGIGRTYGVGILKGQRMSDESWASFREEVWILLTGKLQLNPYSHTTGKGWYVHEDGTPVEEETMLAVVSGTDTIHVLRLPPARSGKTGP